MHTNKKGPNSKYSFKVHKSNIVLANQMSLLNKKQWNGVLFSDKRLGIILTNATKGNHANVFFTGVSAIKWLILGESASSWGNPGSFLMVSFAAQCMLQ